MKSRMVRIVQTRLQRTSIGCQVAVREGGMPKQVAEDLSPSFVRQGIRPLCANDPPRPGTPWG